MDLLNLILDFDPDFQKTLDSEQYFYSKKIIEKRIKLKISQDEYAQLLGIDLNKLLDLEECLLSIPLNEYKDVAGRSDLIHTETLEKMMLSEVQKLVKVTKIDAPSKDDITLNYFNTDIQDKNVNESYCVKGFSTMNNLDIFKSLDTKISLILQHESTTLDEATPVRDKHAISKNKFAKNQIPRPNMEFNFTASESESYFDNSAA